MLVPSGKPGLLQYFMPPTIPAEGFHKYVSSCMKLINFLWRVVIFMQKDGYFHIPGVVNLKYKWITGFSASIFVSLRVFFALYCFCKRLKPSPLGE